MSHTKFIKFLLNRVTATSSVTEYLENCLSTEDDVSKYNFHKIMLHNWTDNEINLYEAMSGFFVTTFVPVHFVTQNGITTFYTSNLSFILKIIKLDFLFPYLRNMCSIDILLNDKTAEELFGARVSIEDVVKNVVNSRLDPNLELDLSDFCNDKEFMDKKIHFYKLSLLGQFKIIMLRIGKDTKYLNLSRNNLSQVPPEILNFFIKGDLIGVNLSDNNIPSIVELQRVSSKIEKLWIEGNPLCENIDPFDYIKQISMKFPRLTELDGIKINNHGLMMPFYKSYLVSSTKKTRMLIEKFVVLYFSHFDSSERKIGTFYDKDATLSITCDFPDEAPLKIKKFNRNILEKNRKLPSFIKGSNVITFILRKLPRTIHDRSTFTVDVLDHDKKKMILVIEGVYKERDSPADGKKFFFRRTFWFNVFISASNYSVYSITNEMFFLTYASEEVANNSFKVPIRNENQLSLLEPDADDRSIMCKAFSYYTKLKRAECEKRLKENDWDIRETIQKFMRDHRSRKVPQDRFITDGNLSDISLDDEVD